jgi:hypothetical protein
VEPWAWALLGVLRKMKIGGENDYTSINNRNKMFDFSTPKATSKSVDISFEANCLVCSPWKIESFQHP